MSVSEQIKRLGGRDGTPEPLSMDKDALPLIVLAGVNVKHDCQRIYVNQKGVELLAYAAHRMAELKDPATVANIEVAINGKLVKIEIIPSTQAQFGTGR